MKTDTLVILAAAGLGLWFVTKSTRANPSMATSAASLNNGGQVAVPNRIASIFDSTVKTGQGGWQYFKDGSAIGPDGARYSNGYF